MASEHIYKQFDEDLEAIRSKVLEMGSIVEEQITDAIKSLVESDTKLANKIISRDARVNELETIINEDCSLFIAKRSPAAGDLRNILMILKIINDLERIGDEAAKIAQATIRIFEDDRMSKPRFKQITLMAKNVGSMLKDALNSFARSDTTNTMSVLKRDQEVDDDYRLYMRQLLTYMLEDPRTISMSLESIFIAKSLERIGDHAQNIAEGVIYSVSGTDVSHASFKEIKETLSN